MVINVYRSSCKVPVILVRLYCDLDFLETLSKSSQILNFMNIPLLETELFHADGRTD